MDILIHLKEEHQAIKEKLEELKTAPYSELPDLLREISHLVEDVHHQKEENILFPEVARTQMSSQGGPRCTYFMGLRIEADSINKKIIHFLNENKIPIKNHTHNELCDQLIKVNHALSIPLGEHILGSSLMDYLKTFPEFTKLHKARDLYIELITLHIEKEDDCLFEMLKQILPLSEREKLYKKVIS